MDLNGVTNKFISQDDIEEARAKKEAQWKAAYARLGQEPPKPQEDNVPFDGRSLAEKLAANRAAKNEEMEERQKMSAQFRALEEDEVNFLNSIKERQEAEERERKQAEGEELKNFKEAVAARAVAEPPTLPSSASAPKPPAAPVVKKDKAKSLKGVVVKKKPKTAQPMAKPAEAKEKEDSDLPDPKRRRVEET